MPREARPQSPRAHSNVTMRSARPMMARIGTSPAEPPVDRSAAQTKEPTRPQPTTSSVAKAYACPAPLALVGPGTKPLLVEPSDQRPRRFRELPAIPKSQLAKRIEQLADDTDKIKTRAEWQVGVLANVLIEEAKEKAP
jgi:hypothetical protein